MKLEQRRRSPVGVPRRTRPGAQADHFGFVGGTRCDVIDARRYPNAIIVSYESACACWSLSSERYLTEVTEHRSVLFFRLDRRLACPRTRLTPVLIASPHSPAQPTMATQTHMAPKEADRRDGNTGHGNGNSNGSTTANRATMACPDPSAHRTKDAHLQNQASAAALYSTNPPKSTPRNALGADGKLSSASMSHVRDPFTATL